MARARIHWLVLRFAPAFSKQGTLMKMRIRISTLWVVTALTLGMLTPPTASAVKEYYSISRSIRALGMGGAFYGRSDDQDAVFYNPAGLGFYEGGNDLMASMKLDGSTSLAQAVTVLTRPGARTVASTITDLDALSGNPIFVSATPVHGYYLRKYFTMGLLLADTKGTMAILGKDLDTTVDITAISDSGLFVGFAYPVMPGLVVGANLKGMFRAGGQKTYTVLEIAQNQALSTNLQTLGGAGGGIDFDLGVTYQLPTIIPGVTNRVSVTANNLMASNFTMFKLDATTGPPPGLPRMLTVSGMTRLPGFWIMDRLDLLLDLAEFQIGGVTNADHGARGGSLWKHVNFGGEALFWGWLYGRMGFRQGNFTIGAGIDARFFQIDIATYAEELASLPGRLSSRRVALRLAAGFGGANPTVAPATQTTVPTPEPKAKKESPALEDVKSPAVEPPAKTEQPHGKNENLGVEKLSTVSFRQ